MKRFTILFTTLISVLALLAVFQAWSESRVEAKKASIVPVYDSTGTMLEAIPADDVEVRIAPVYDATGAMLEAIHSNEPNAKTTFLIVYDATSAMLEAIDP